MLPSVPTRLVPAVLLLTAAAAGAQPAMTDSRYLFLFHERCATCHGVNSPVPQAASLEALRAFPPRTRVRGADHGDHGGERRGAHRRGEAGPGHLSDRQAVRQRGRPARRGDAERLPGRRGAGRTPGSRAVERLQRRSRHRRPASSPARTPACRRRRSTARSPVVLRPPGQRRDAGPARRGGRARLPRQRQRLRLRPRRPVRLRPLVLRRRNAGRLRRERRDGARHERDAVYFGDWSAHVHAVDAASGQSLWRVRADDHPMAKITGSPVLEPGGRRLYVPVGRGRKAPRSRTGSTSAARRRAPWWSSTSPPGCRSGRATRSPSGPGRSARTGWACSSTAPPAPACGSAPILDMERRAVYVGTANGLHQRARRRVERRGDRVRPRHRRAALVLPAPRRRPGTAG